MTDQKLMRVDPRRALPLLLLVTILFAAGSAPGGSATPLADAPPLTDAQLDRLRSVAAWDVEFTTAGKEEYHTSWSLEASGLTSVSSDRVIETAHTARLTVTPRFGEPGCSTASPCASDFSFPALLSVTADGDSLLTVFNTSRGCPPGAEGPGSQVDTVSTIRSASFTERDLQPLVSGDPRLNVFKLDYRSNPPRAEAAIQFWAPPYGTSRETAAGCAANYDRPISLGARDYGVYFYFADPAEPTEGGDTQVRIENGRFVVRGSGKFSASDEIPCDWFIPVECGFSQPGLFPPAPVQRATFEETEWVAREHRTCDPAKDTDGDALLDCWETEGIDVDGDGDTDLDLPQMGADPKHKDVFVEVDAMAGHALSQAAIDTVVAAFGVAPVSNPDKTSGINLHVDNGPGSTMNPVTGELWGPLSDADTVAHVDMLGEMTATGKYNWHDFQNIKNANFSSDRQPVFHYALSAHDYTAHHSSGISRNDSGAFFTGASDFLVTLGAACASDPCSPGAGLQSGTFMHELGHNLGLAHGGNDHLNRKPNYLSVMSYAFQFPGLIVNGAAGRYDYSRFGVASLAVLNEFALDETTGFGATDSRLSAYDTLIHCTAGSGWQQVPVTGAQDWDCQPSPNVVAENISNEGGLTLLRPFDDWPNLVFSGGAVGDLGGAIELPMETELIEPPLSVLLETACVLDPVDALCARDTTAPATSATAAPAPDAAGWNNGDVTVTLSASDEEGGSGVKEIVYSLGSDPTVIAGPTASVEITSEGESVLTYFARDKAGNEESPQSVTIRLDKTAPTINTSRAPEANAAGWNNTPVTGRFTATDDLSGIEGESSLEVVFGEGAGQSATRTFTDRAGNSASATIVNVNVDLTAPTMSCVASPDVLWPPNHRLRKVSVRVSIADGLSGPGPFALAAAESSEPDNGTGDGNTTGDVREFALGLADTEGMLRAERSGSGRGRVYELRYGGGDLAGNTATCVARVAVPHNLR